MRKILLFLLFVQAICYGQIPDPIPNTYVNDLTGKLTADQIHNLNESILAIEKKSSVQVAVVLVDQLPDGYSIEDYAIQIGRKWHVGNAQNGIVYVAAISQRKQRLEVAGALEHQITDLAALQLTNEVKPFFRQQDYYGGVANLLNGISEKLDPILQEQNALADAEREKKHSNDGFILSMALLSLLVIGGIGYFVFRGYQKKQEAEEREREAEMEREAQARRDKMQREINAIAGLQKANEEPVNKRRTPTTRSQTIVAPIIVDDDTSYRRSSSSSSSSGSSSSSSDDSSYGNWGSGSSDSSSSSGFSGGGSSNDW